MIKLCFMPFHFLIFVGCTESFINDDDYSNEINLLVQSLSLKHGKIGISDAANDGIDEFYFLAPTVDKIPKFHGNFHPGLSPIVEISDDLEFESFHQVFTLNDPVNKISIDRINEQYVVNWETSKSKPEIGKIYRVRVRVGDKVMGYLDVAIVQKSMIKSDGSLKYLELNQKMDIHFRLEEKLCPARIEISPSDECLLLNTKRQYFAHVFNYYEEILEDFEVQWSVGDNLIVSIDENGLAQGKSEGETIIFANAFDVVGQLIVEVCVADDRFGKFIDPRDGMIYKTVKIGNQTWFAQNLNFETEDSFCFDNNPDNCKVYGRLYSWEAVQNACPSGWHLPNQQEWEILAENLGGFEFAGGKMKAIQGWVLPNIGATNESLFSALASGLREDFPDEPELFYSLGTSTSFWGAINFNNNQAVYNNYFISNSQIYLRRVNTTNDVISYYSNPCRCIQDN